MAESKAENNPLLILGLDPKDTQEALNALGDLKEKFQGIDKALPDLSIRKQLGLTQDHLEALYSVAYNFYTTGNYEKALKLFRSLVLIHHSDYRFNLGMGCCLQMLKKYKEAIQIFLAASTIDENDPRCFSYALECALNDHNTGMALFCAEKCIARAGKNKNFEAMRHQAVTVLGLLSAEQPSKKTKKKSTKKNSKNK